MKTTAVTETTGRKKDDSWTERAMDNPDGIGVTGGETLVVGEMIETPARTVEEEAGVVARVRTLPRMLLMMHAVGAVNRARTPPRMPSMMHAAVATIRVGTPPRMLSGMPTVTAGRVTEIHVQFS